MTADRDDELEAFLQRRSPLHQRFAEPDRLEPPPELDRVVLSRAREAIRAPEPERVFRPARWALPFSLAAVLVLSFAVMLSFRLAQPESADAGYVAQATSARSVPQPAASDAAAETETSAGSRVSTEESESMRQEERAPEKARLVARREQAKRSHDVVVAGADYEHAVPAEPQTAAPLDESERVASESDVVLAMNQRSHAQAPPAEPDESQVRVAGSTAPSRPRDASSWLKQIDELRAAGRTAQAEREWVAFRKAYPNHARVRGADESPAAEPPVQAEHSPPAEQPPSEPAR